MFSMLEIYFVIRSDSPGCLGSDSDFTDHDDTGRSSLAIMINFKLTVT